jgi:hypothetical protein
MARKVERRGEQKSVSTLGGYDMGDKGDKDKSKRDQQKKVAVGTKDKRKQKAEKKSKD